MLDAVLVAIGAAVEATQLVVQSAAEGDVDGGGARTHIGECADQQSFAVVVERERCGLPINEHGLDVELGGVEGDEACGGNDISRDDDIAGEGCTGQIGCEHEVVAPGQNVPGQAVRIEFGCVTRGENGHGPSVLAN